MDEQTKYHTQAGGPGCVLAAQREQVRRFYATHPYKHLRVGAAAWAYISCGPGPDTLLILPGGTRTGYPFLTIPDFEAAYRVIMPVYPLVRTMAEVVEGLAAILHAEGVARVHILGSSFGGMVAQCFAQRYPEQIDELILANTGAPDPDAAAYWSRQTATMRLLPERLLGALFRRKVLAELRDVPPGEEALLRAYTTALVRQTPKAWYLCSAALVRDFTQHYRFAPLADATPGDAKDRSPLMLILESEHDSYYPEPARAALRTLYPQARVHTFVAAGHTVGLTRRAEYAAVIKGFLAENRAKGAPEAVEAHSHPVPPAALSGTPGRSKAPRSRQRAAEDFYQAVPAGQAAQLVRFRATHAPKHLAVGGRNWAYLACGQGADCLVLLPGGLQIGEPFFRLVLALEDQYRLIVPSYPPVDSVAQLVDGLRAILDAEGIAQAHVLGTSLGGMLAQCFVRQYPQRVGKLVLGDTAVPDPGYGRKFQTVSKVVARLPLPLLQGLARRRFATYLAAVLASEQAFWRAYFTEYASVEWTRVRINTQYACLIDFCRRYAFTGADLAAWPGAILIIEAQDDPVISPDLRVALRATYPQAQVYTFQGSGHIPGITRQAEYLAVLQAFLADRPLPSAADTMPASPYYLAQRPRLLRAFDKAIQRSRPTLAAQLGYDPETVTALIAEVRGELTALIPTLPYIGGRHNRLSWNLEESAQFLALYRVLCRRGHTLQEVGQLVSALTAAWYGRYPRWVLRLLGRLQFTRWNAARLQQAAAQSQRRRYPGDFVYHFIPGDGRTFDFGVDYTACAICQFYHAQGADAFTPYLCPLDYVISAACDLGMVRTTTLAEGGPRCDFRFQHGRPTVPRWPGRAVAAQNVPPGALKADPAPAGVRPSEGRGHHDQ